MDIRKLFCMVKNDRLVVLSLLLVGVIVVALFKGVDSKPPSSDDQQRAADTSSTRNGADRRPAYAVGQGQKGGEKGAEPYYDASERQVERFTFDPNTADSTQLLRLGLSSWQVRSLYRYRARGGVFQRPTDFARLYGLTQKQYRELLPYIRIAADYRPASELVGDRRSEGRDGGSREYASNGNETPLQASASYPHKLSAGEHVVLNQADTTELKRVPGIGSYYARRIVSYGQRLGGYVSVEQLLEIDGFPEDALPFFQVNTDNVKKMNLNTLSFSKIRQHPYVNFYQARAINDHRRLKGPLNGIDDLRHLPDFPPETIERLRPYVTF